MSCHSQVPGKTRQCIVTILNELNSQGMNGEKESYLIKESTVEPSK